MKHFLLSLGLLLVCVTASLAQDRLEQVGPNDPAWEDVFLFAENGLIEDTWSQKRQLIASRPELAVATIWILRRLGVLNKNSSGGSLIPQYPESPLLNKPEIVAALKRLTISFQPELKRIGVPIEQIKINGVFLIEPQNAQPKLPIAPPFADVPKDHWAYEAVETLRQAGIIIGIPAGEKAVFNSPTTK